MITRRSVVLIGLALIAVAAVAQEKTPYADQQHREIKALPPGEVEAYLGGKGMGLAKAAELNGYPGPKHVLELADELDLTPGQRERSRALFDRMHADAVRLGNSIVKKERDLDQLFAEDRIREQSMNTRLAEIGALKAKLRGVHLRAHLDQRALLTKPQIAAYRTLRGYVGNGTRGEHRHHGVAPENDPP